MQCPEPYEQYDYDEELSFKNFANWKFRNREDYDFNGKVIYSTLFYNESPDSEIFPEGMKGVTFIKCNLDNLIIPENNTIIDCTQERFEIQNDLNDWLIDEKNAPVLPVMGVKAFLKRGLEVPKPEDIPQEKVAERVDLLQKAVEAKIAADALEFIGGN